MPQPSSISPAAGVTPRSSARDAGSTCAGVQPGTRIAPCASAIGGQRSWAISSPRICAEAPRNCRNAARPRAVSGAAGRSGAPRAPRKIGGRPGIQSWTVVRPEAGRRRAAPAPPRSPRPARGEPTSLAHLDQPRRRFEPQPPARVQHGAHGREVDPELPLVVGDPAPVEATLLRRLGQPPRDRAPPASAPSIPGTVSPWA